jgi:hypothetical protein
MLCVQCTSSLGRAIFVSVGLGQEEVGHHSLPLVGACDELLSQLAVEPVHCPLVLLCAFICIVHASSTSAAAFASGSSASPASPLHRCECPSPPGSLQSYSPFAPSLRLRGSPATPARGRCGGLTAGHVRLPSTQLAQQLRQAVHVPHVPRVRTRVLLTCSCFVHRIHTTFVPQVIRTKLRAIRYLSDGSNTTMGSNRRERICVR